MRKPSLGFVAEGLRRLLHGPAYREKQAAIEAKIREKYAAELAAATGYWQRLEIEGQIRREIQATEPSPYSLWSTSGCFAPVGGSSKSRRPT